MRISPYHSCEISPHAQIYLAIFSLLRNKTRIKFHFSAHQTITEVSICFVFLSLFLSRSLAPFPVILPFFILPWFHFFTAEKREEKREKSDFLPLPTAMISRRTRANSDWTTVKTDRSVFVIK